ncbi:electron transfer flavoprotein subunit alpha/FixB family protein [Roseixanthobacter glucoisosaccharinicivorans]|uniref:electron transfer flavoprotein subunit alpha/FixB family protein n=1 Tax=Roseixanthobacter glucoisosaccharinicivorans TaxID=3119923 RepID=UPI0037268688
MSRLRRDPRAERAGRQVVQQVSGPAMKPPALGPLGAAALQAGRRPRFDLFGALQPGAAPNTPRRDPRARWAAARIPGGSRPRFDLSLSGQGVATEARAPQGETAAPELAVQAPQVLIIDDPAFLVLALADAPGGHLSAQDRQLLGAARLLADGGGGAVLLLAAEVPPEAGTAGADRVAGLSGADADGRADALAAAILALAPRHMLFAETPTGGDLARRVAVRLNEPLFCGAEQISAKSVARPARGGTVERGCAPPRLITLADGAAVPHGPVVHEARPLELPRPAPRDSFILAVEEVPADPATVALGEADFVLSAGNGVSDFAAFRALAEALGATPGASRMVCDAGHMPRAAQVGASGTVLAARCYFALGIAGAPQHLQGIAGCEHVLAVNTDLHAAMVARAGLAIVQDAQLVMPALLKALREEGA